MFTCNAWSEPSELNPSSVTPLAYRNTGVGAGFTCGFGLVSGSWDDVEDLASSARKNIDDPTELPVDEPGCDCTFKLCTSSGPLFFLEVLVGSPLRFPASGLWSETGPTLDIGRGGNDMLGGVSEGGVAVPSVPSRREFREPDRGVMFVLRNAETGVDTSSLEDKGVPVLVELCGV